MVCSRNLALGLVWKIESTVFFQTSPKIGNCFIQLPTACRKTSPWSAFLQADAVFGGKAAKNKNRAEQGSASIFRLWSQFGEKPWRFFSKPLFPPKFITFDFLYKLRAKTDSLFALLEKLCLLFGFLNDDVFGFIDISGQLCEREPSLGALLRFLELVPIGVVCGFSSEIFCAQGRKAQEY